MEKQRGDLCRIFASLRYVLPPSAVRPPTSDSFCAKDILALVIIIYSAKLRAGGLTRVGGMPNLDKIRQDATTYFLILSTGHLLFFFLRNFRTRE